MSDQKTAFTLFNSLLNLPGVKVVDIRESTDGCQVVIVVESTQDTVNCRQCGKPTQSHGHGRQIRLRHLALLGKETYIEITPKRGRCDGCDGGMTTTERHNWYEKHKKMTKAYEQHLLFELINSTVSDVSRKEGVDYHAIDNFILSTIESKIDYSTIVELGVLGLDEISLKKGYRDFVTLITYRIDSKVHMLGLVKGREKAAIIAFLKKIPRRLRKTIKAICCDLYDGYINASKEVFKKKVPVVADRFHVKKLYHRGLINIRKSELKRLQKTLDDKDYTKLKPAIAILRKQKDYFTEDEKEVVSQLFSHSPKLKQAYEFSRALSGMFDSDMTPEKARVKMREWIDDVMDSDLCCFNAFIKTVTKYEAEISHYFIRGDSSGFVEGFNNRVKVLKRRCYGLSNVTKLFQRLILDTEGFYRFAPLARTI